MIKAILTDIEGDTKCPIGFVNDLLISYASRDRSTGLNLR